MTDVSVLGIGLMGTAVTNALLSGGKTVTVWNRSPAKAEELRSKGAAVAGTARQAINDSPVSILVLPSYDIVKTVLDDSRSELSGHVIVNLTTGQPARRSSRPGGMDHRPWRPPA
jgi:3-hydroxyisobutyrate dehydrogenase-like beta-hydroxyacid dehydrogenase